MNELFEELRYDSDMKDMEYRHAFAEAHLNSMIAMQIKVLREQRNLSQMALGEFSDMAQPRISVLEDVNYSAWSISTLKRLARAFDLRLRVSFEDFGSLESELGVQGPASFERVSFPEDPKFYRPKIKESQGYAVNSAGEPSGGIFSTNNPSSAVQRPAAAVASGNTIYPLPKFQPPNENGSIPGSAESLNWSESLGTNGVLEDAA